MDISTLTPKKQVKIQFWLKVIKECRASGLTNRDWCEQNNIHLKQYYYWIAKVRKMALEDLPRKENGSSLSSLNESAPAPMVYHPPSDFVELPIQRTSSCARTPTAVIHSGNISIDLFSADPAEVITAVLKAVQSC